MNILLYVLVAVVGFVLGQFMDWCNIRFSSEKKIFSKEFFTEHLKELKINYPICIINSLIFVGLFYRYGISLEFFKYSFLGTCLITAFVVDFYLEIIPNKLNLTIFLGGLIFAIIGQIWHLSSIIDMILGMLAGGGIFLIITLIGGLIAGKEAMGLGDVKLMGAMGMIVGFIPIIIISILSFFVGGILIAVLLISKKKTLQDYIPFGPSIVIASYIVMLVPIYLIIGSFLWLVTLGKFKMF